MFSSGEFTIIGDNVQVEQVYMPVALQFVEMEGRCGVV